MTTLFCKEQNMAQILAPSTQWQTRITKTSPNASPITSNMWSSLLWKQNKKVARASKFRVLAIKSDGSTINRLEGLLNLDVTPYTDKFIAEYIWYFIIFFFFCLYLIVCKINFSITISFFILLYEDTRYLKL